MRCRFESQPCDKVRVYDNGIIIVLRSKEKTWSVYYGRVYSSLTYGFSIPYDGSTESQVWALAEANALRLYLPFCMD